MTQNKQDQVDEIEALESIYPDELKIVESEPFHSFTLSLAAEFREYDGAEEVDCVLQFTYTKDYPESAPIMEVVESENMDDNDIEKISDHMKETAEENIGMAMVFTIVSEVQDMLDALVKQMYTDKKEAEELKRKQAEEAEQKRFEGTRVSVENFMTWKAKFDAEMQAKKLKEGVIIDLSKKKMTGKELFMTDNTLEDSDIQFLQDDGECAVAVDESLFEDLDDLDLGDD